jgi:hypothetical protein
MLRDQDGHVVDVLLERGDIIDGWVGDEMGFHRPLPMTRNLSPQDASGQFLVAVRVLPGALTIASAFAHRAAHLGEAVSAG